MDAPRRTGPGMYARLRQNALTMRLPDLPLDAVHAVLMDWHVDHGTVSVLAAADGTASLYFSSGGGLLGGGQRSPQIRSAALHAVSLATSLLSLFEPTTFTSLPSLGDVTFYLATGVEVRVAVAAEARLRRGADPLAALGGAMQRIVTEYRLRFPKPPSSPPPAG